MKTKNLKTGYGREGYCRFEVCVNEEVVDSSITRAMDMAHLVERTVGFEAGWTKRGTLYQMLVTN